MTQERCSLMTRRGPVEMEIPQDWRLGTLAVFPEGPPPLDVKKRTREVLAHPVGHPPLKEVLRPNERVAILVEDLTRVSPKKAILEELLRELREMGVPPHNVVLVMALGTHRGLSNAELIEGFGEELVRQYAFVNHDCLADDLVPIGQLSTGATVRINRLVQEAHFRMGIGAVFPHPMNGFGGGGKILFPGVGDFKAIQEHHLRWTFHPGTGFGITQGNPFHEEVVRMARQANLHFIINSVLNQRDEAADLVAGDPVYAHEAGIEQSRKILTRTFSQKADITFITSYPYSEGPQIVKPLAPASLVTKEGGTIVLCADCTGNLPDAFVHCFERFHAAYSHDLEGSVLDHFHHGRLIMEEGAIDFNMALAMTLCIQHRFRILLVSQDIPRETARKMGFLHADTPASAVDILQKMHVQPSVHLIPSGGVILPVL